MTAVYGPRLGVVRRPDTGVLNVTVPDRKPHGSHACHHVRPRRRPPARRRPAAASISARSSARRRSPGGWRSPSTRPKKLKEPLGHILFDGPPGLGKTTFATVLPNELGTSIQMTSGPALSKPADLLPFLTNLEEGSVLFIDEIHRMPRVVEEFIYPAMEDFRIDIVLGEGMNARTISMQLEAVHADRRDDPQRHAVRPDARPLQDARAPGVLQRRGTGRRSSASTPAS